MLPNHPKQHNISLLWSKFLEITELLSSSGSQVDKKVMEDSEQANQTEIFNTLNTVNLPTHRVLGFTNVFNYKVKIVHVKIAQFFNSNLWKFSL